MIPAVVILGIVAFVEAVLLLFIFSELRSSNEFLDKALKGWNKSIDSRQELLGNLTEALDMVEELTNALSAVTPNPKGGKDD